MLKLILPQWLEALPSPRIVHVQRLLNSGRDAEEEWYSDTQYPENGEEVVYEPVHSYFCSPAPTTRITTLVQTCHESRLTVKNEYALLFPKSSTWFSFERDTLYLDFGLASSHTKPFALRDLTLDLPDPPYIARCRSLARYVRPELNYKLCKKVKNLAITTVIVELEDDQDDFAEQLLIAFPLVETLIFAHAFHRSCWDSKAELTWLYENDQRGLGHASQKDLDLAKRLPNLLIWAWPLNCDLYAKGEVESGLIRALKRLSAIRGQRMPSIIWNDITTVECKSRLLQICKSDKGLQELDGLDWGFVRGEDEYRGPLDLAGQIAFLEYAMERIWSVHFKHCDACSDLGHLLDAIVELRGKINLLGLESVRQHEAEDGD